MFRNLLTATLTATLLASTAPAFAATMVKEVDVSADLAAIKNPKAATYWTKVSDDLENAIVTRLTPDRIADNGAKITIDIDEVELANSFQETMGIADSKLVGSVSVTSDDDNTVFDGYVLTISYADTVPFFPEGTDLTKITNDSKEHYDAMIAAFATRVVTDLK